KRAMFFSVLGAAVATTLLGGAFAIASQTNFVLGSTTNTPDAVSVVTAKNVDGKGGINDRMIQLVNDSTSSNATALSLHVNGRRPPLSVNPSARIPNLNADRLDGLDSSVLAQGIPSAAGYATPTSKTLFAREHEYTRSADVRDLLVVPGVLTIETSCTSDGN